MSINTRKAIVPIFIAAAVLGTAMALPIFGLQHVAAASDEKKDSDSANKSMTTKETTATASSATTSSIKMTAKEVDETYKWSTSDGANPTLKMTANADNSVQIANPTDAKHELVIESHGKEVASSGDIAANGSGQLSFKPTAPGTYEYHCEYHPTTMKGTIEVSAH